MVLLVYLVPALGHRDLDDANPNMTYPEVAKSTAGSWFDVNPVHCLRSKYIHKHKPHCRFLSVGKDHLLQANPKIGVFFEVEPAETEEFRMYRLSDFTDTFKALGGAVMGKK